MQLKSKGNCHLKDGQFRQKETSIKLLLQRKDDREAKKSGEVKLDMSEILNPKDLSRDVSRKYEKKL